MKLKKKMKPVESTQLAVLSENVTEDKFERVTVGDDLKLSALVAKADEIQSMCTDVNDVFMDNLYLNKDLHLETKSGENVGVSPYAFSQLCTKLGIPTLYMKKCIETGFVPLVQENINKWLQWGADKKLLIRKYGEVARGILSNRYSICDTPEILSAISDSGILKNMSLQGYMINPSRFHARFIGAEMKVIGEDLFAGVQIDSSDVGRSKLDIKFFVFKQVCTNGLVLPEAAGAIYTQKHIGISSEDMTKALHESFNVFNEQVSDATDIITHAQSVKINDMEDYRNRVRNGTRVGEDSVDEIFTIAVENYDSSVWGLVNAITEVSQKYTLEHRLLMERYAGVLLTQSLRGGV